MSFKREMLNTVTTLGGVYLSQQAVTRLTAGSNVAISSPQMAAKMAAGLVGGYLGNLIANGSTEDELRKRVYDQTLKKLEELSVKKENTAELFDKYYNKDASLKPSFLRNVGNLFSTRLAASIGTPLGFLSTTALTTFAGKGLDRMMGGGNKAASYGFVAGMLAGPVIGAVGLGYLGNKLFAQVGKKAIRKQSDDIVARILQEKSPSTDPSFVNTLTSQRQSAKPEEVAL